MVGGALSTAAGTALTVTGLFTRAAFEGPASDSLGTAAFVAGMGAVGIGVAAVGRGYAGAKAPASSDIEMQPSQPRES